MQHLSDEILKDLDEALRAAIIKGFEGQKTARTGDLLPAVEDALVEVAAKHGLAGERLAHAVALIMKRLAQSEWKAPAFGVKPPAPILSTTN